MPSFDFALVDDPFPDNGNDAQGDNAECDKREILFDDFEVPYEISSYQERDDPKHASSDVVHPELGKVHFTDPATKGAKFER